MNYSLGPSVLAEPLVNQWGAWWMNVAPIPASLHLHNSQMTAMRSYLKNPALHAKIASDPALSGTSYIGVHPTQANEVEKILARSESELSDMTDMATAVGQLEEMLRKEAKGQAMAPFYSRLPIPLRGLVELLYDYQNRPSFRLIEPLTYRCSAYKPNLQSMRFSHLVADNERRFLYSTPYVTGPSDFLWQLPFSDPRIDYLFGLDVEAKPLGEIIEVLQLDRESGEEFRKFLTNVQLKTNPEWREEAIRIRYLGHASVLVEYGGVSILIDPVMSATPQNGGERRHNFQDLPRYIDFVLITHAHGDHFCLETLLRLRHRIGCLVVPRASQALVGDVSLALMAKILGFTNVVEIAPMDSLPFVGGEVIAIPFLGEHGDLAHSKSGYLVRIGTEKILFAADSHCIDAMVYERVYEIVGPISTVFVNTETEGAPLTFPIEALFPKERDRRPERDRRCRGSNAAEAMELLIAVRAKRVYNYAMGLEPWVGHLLGIAPPSSHQSSRMEDADDLIRRAREAGLAVAERLYGVQDIFIPIGGTS